MAGRQILRGTNAQRVALGGLSVGEFGFETDTKDVYIGAAGGDHRIPSAGDINALQTEKLDRDGAIPLTGNWAAGAFDIQALSFSIGVNKLTTAEFAHLDGQDQAVKTTSSPTFAKQILRAAAPHEATFGPDLVVNGGFATLDFTGWTAGANWSAATGVAKRTAAASTTLAQSINLTINESYRVVLVTSLRTAGTLALTFGALVGSYQVGANGTHIWTFRAVATAAYSLTFTPDANFDGAIDDVTVERVIPGISLADYYDSTGGLVVELRTNLIRSGLAFGLNSMRKIVVGNSLYISDAGFNTFFGVRSGEENTVGAQNSFFGAQAGQSNTTGYHCSFFGAGAGQGNNVGFYNSFFGCDAGLVVQDGNNDCLFGTGCGVKLLSGSQNCFYGVSAGGAITTGSQSCLFGYLAGSAGVTAQMNAYFGWATGYFCTGSFNVFLGCGAGYWETTNDNTLYIDNAIRADQGDARIKAMVFGTFAAASANQRFRINARLGVTHLPNYANNAAAVAGGLTSGELYTATGTDPLQVAAVV